MSSLDSAGKTNFVRQCGAAPGDLILFGVGPVTSVNKTLDRLRLFVAHDMDLIDHVSFSIGQSLFFFFFPFDACSSDLCSFLFLYSPSTRFYG